MAYYTVQWYILVILFLYYLYYSIYYIQEYPRHDLKLSIFYLLI